MTSPSGKQRRLPEATLPLRQVSDGNFSASPLEPLFFGAS